MPVEIVALCAFVIIFLLGSIRSVNMGAIALVGAFLVGTLVYNVTPAKVLDGFPGEMFVILVGVTYLFALANHNGTIDWLIQAAVNAVGGRVALIPWVMFLVPAALTAVGAAAPAACAIVIPIALKFAARHKINPVMMSMMVIQGTTAGGFSPIGIYGVIVNGIGAKAGLETSPQLLFFGVFITTFALAAAAYFGMGGRRLVRLGGAAPHIVDETGPAQKHAGGPAASTPSDGTNPQGSSHQIAATLVSEPMGGASPISSVRTRTPEQILTLLGIVSLVVLTVAFGYNVGFVALTIAVVLSLIYTKSAKAAVAGIAWPTVLLIGGIITYVALLQEQGTVEWLGSNIAGINAPLLAAFLILLIGAVVSAFASTTALLGVVIPLATPFLLAGEIGVTPLIIALAVSSSVVDCSPFSTMGALAVANAEESSRDRVFSGLMRWGMTLIIAAPIATFLALVLPSAI